MATTDPQPPADPEKVWEDLQDFATDDFVDQLKNQSVQVYKSVLAELGGVKLTLQEEKDLAWSINTLLASGVLAVGADQATLERLERDRLTAAATVDNIKSIEITAASQVVTNTIARILAMGQTFLLQGVQAALAIGLRVIP